MATALYKRPGGRMWIGHLIHHWLPTMAECGAAWLEWFAGYCLHSWLPHRLWQMTYCTLCRAKLKIWLTVGHWPRVVTASTMKTPWPLTICWWWKAMSPFLGVCSVRPMFTDVTGDVCNTLSTSFGEDMKMSSHHALLTSANLHGLLVLHGHVSH